MTISAHLSRITTLAVFGALLGACTPPASSPSYDLTMQPLQTPAAARSGQATLSRSPAGQVVLSWLDHEPDGSAALRSVDYATSGWHSPTTVARGSNWFVNWADFGAVIALAGKQRLAHWRVRSGAATYAYDIHVALSPDDGKHWEAPFVLHQDGTRTEHGFVSVYATKTGAGINWLDGRATESGGGHDDHAPGGSMQLFNAQLGGEASRPRSIDQRVCDCCQTASAATDSGPVVAYRDRSDGEIRDIVVARLGQDSQTPPVTLGTDHWKIEGCPVNGPAMAASGDRVAVAWFTGAGGVPRVQLAFSHDGARQFDDALLIDDVKPFGRVDVVWLNDDDVAVSWMCQSESDTAQLCIRRVAYSGAMSPPYTVVPLESARRSGFPQLERSGDTLIFAWQAAGEDDSGTQVRTGTLPVRALR